MDGWIRYEYKAPSKAKGKGASELPASPLDSVTPVVAVDDTQTLTFTAAVSHHSTPRHKHTNTH